MEWRCGTHLVSDDRSRLDRAMIHAVLAQSYWARGIPRATVERSIENSLCFGLYACEDETGPGGHQLGFARAITDRATFAYLADVFVLEAGRGQGLGRFLVECVHAHPDLSDLRRWLLVTRDAHGLYRKLGWRELAEPKRHMEIVVPDAYIS